MDYLSYRLSLTYDAQAELDRVEWEEWQGEGQGDPALIPPTPPDAADDVEEF